MGPDGLSAAVVSVAPHQELRGSKLRRQVVVAAAGCAKGGGVGADGVSHGDGARGACAHLQVTTNMGNDDTDCAGIGSLGTCPLWLAWSARLYVMEECKQGERGEGGLGRPQRWG